VKILSYSYLIIVIFLSNICRADIVDSEQWSIVENGTSLAKTQVLKNHIFENPIYLSKEIQYLDERLMKRDIQKLDSFYSYMIKYEDKEMLDDVIIWNIIESLALSSDVENKELFLKVILSRKYLSPIADIANKLFFNKTRALNYSSLQDQKIFEKEISDFVALKIYLLILSKVQAFHSFAIKNIADYLSGIAKDQLSNGLKSQQPLLFQLNSSYQALLASAQMEKNDPDYAASMNFQRKYNQGTIFERTLSYDYLFSDLITSRGSDLVNFDGTSMMVPDKSLQVMMEMMERRALANSLSLNKVIIPVKQLNDGKNQQFMMNWNGGASITIGRCGDYSIPISGIGPIQTSLERNCDYSKEGSTTTNSGAHLTLKTEKSDRSLKITALVASKLRGGYATSGRNENQTAVVNYNVEGNLLIEKCEDIRFCNPVITIGRTSYNDIQFNYNDFPKTKTKDSEEDVLVNGKSLAEGEVLVLDRTKGSVAVVIKMKRYDKHVGACCNPTAGQSKVSLTISNVGQKNTEYSPWGQAGMFPLSNPCVNLFMPMVTSFTSMQSFLSSICTLQTSADVRVNSNAIEDTILEMFNGREQESDKIKYIFSTLLLLKDYIEKSASTAVSPDVVRYLMLLRQNISNMAYERIYPLIKDELKTKRSILDSYEKTLLVNELLTFVREQIESSDFNIKTQRESIVRTVTKILERTNDQQLLADLEIINSHDEWNKGALIDVISKVQSSQINFADMLTDDIQVLVKELAQFENIQ